MRPDSRLLQRHTGALVMFIAFSLTAFNAHAQSYAIEMIIFANIDGDDRYSETWQAEPGLPDISRAAPISSADNGVVAVASSAYRLSGIWQVLRGSSQFRPLRHLAWTQRGRSSRFAPEILLGDSPTSDVFGTVRLSRSRFLHLNLDLLLSDDNGSYRLTNHRRMRSNELNYIDHPLFGVLVIATPL
ncbi:MAG: hypothetical protein ACI9DC_003583 [Gammaproteobacteria bacterium]